MSVAERGRRPAAAGVTVRGVVISACAFAVAGWMQSESTEQFFAFLSILSASVLPTVLWIRAGASGIPILPAVCLAYIPYFAWPILSVHETMLTYSLQEILRSGLTIVLFLAAATLAWKLVRRGSPGNRGLLSGPEEERLVVRLVMTGVCVGVVFHAGLIVGFLGWLGTFFGVVRSLSLTLVTISFFVAGYARGRALYRGDEWKVVLAGVVMIVAMALSSLFLVGGMLYLLAAAFGYVIAAKRVPWASFAAVVIVFAVLHAGKAEMRRKYWMQQANYGDNMSIVDLPAFAVEWLKTGVNTIIEGDKGGQNIVDRVSLLRMLLRVERATPESIDYLRGETYALFPATLVPRFIDPEKPASQVGMELLNIRYGVQTVEAAAVTAIGWGLVPEAYANFGYSGVVWAGILLGILCALLENWSARSGVVSIPTLVAIASMMVLINLEEDFINVALALLQSAASVAVFYFVYKRMLVKRRARRAAMELEVVL